MEVAPPHIAKRQPSKAPAKGHSPAIQAAPATPSKRSIVKNDKDSANIVSPKSSLTSQHSQHGVYEGTYLLVAQTLYDTYNS